MASAAAHEVFSITELLEEILLSLPVATLSSCKQVCRQWKGTVEGSSPIQKKLFLKSSDFYDFKCDGFFWPTLIESTSNPSCYQAYIMNPMIGPYTSNLEKLAREPHGPWQNTLLSQPAMTKLEICIWVRTRAFRGKTLNRFITNPRGITIWDVAHWAKKFVANQRCDIQKNIYLPPSEGWMG